MSRVDKEAFAHWIPLCWAVDCKWRYRKQRGIQRIFCCLNIDTTLTLTTQKLYTSFHNTLTLKPWGFANSVPGATLILGERISPVCIIAAFLSRQKLPRCQNWVKDICFHMLHVYLSQFDKSVHLMMIGLHFDSCCFSVFFWCIDSPFNF